MEHPRFRNRWGSLRRVLAEGVVIVGSILLAFSIDAYWEQRGERAEEHTLLVNLEAEFTENLARLDRLLTFHERAEASGARLLDIAWSRENYPENQVIDSLLVAVFLVGGTFNPSSGALTSFLTSGNPELIGNQHLRDLLTSWPGVIQDNEEDESRVMRLIDDRLTPFLLSHASLAQAYAADASGIEMYGTFEAGPERVDLRRVVQSREFRNHVVTRVTLERLVKREYAKLGSSADEILALIKNEIGRD
jgi:hypothetical protein